MSDEQIVDDLTKPYFVVVNFTYPKFRQFHNYVMAIRELVVNIDPNRLSLHESFVDHKTFFYGDARIHRVFLLTFSNDLALAMQFMLQMPQNEWVKAVLLVDLRDQQQLEQFKRMLATEIPNVS